MSYYTSVIILVLFALVALSVLIFENNRIPPGKKRLFIETNVLIALAAVAECAGVHINGNESVPGGLLAAVKAADYTLTPLTGGALMALMQKPGRKKSPVRWLFIGNALFQLVSAFQGWMVVIDEHNHYTHGSFYPLYMVFYLTVLVILAVKLIAYGKSFRKQNRVSLYTTMLLIFCGVGMQEIMGSEHRVAYLALTFGAAYLFIHYSEFSQMQMDDQITEQQGIITYDVLTGVFSRFEYVDAMNEYSANVPGDFAVFTIDINGLKAVNDSLGHEAGDELIRGAARCVEDSVGKNARTFRIGGDEFVVFANMNKEQADSALSELDYATRAWSGDKVKELSVSAGYALAEDYNGYSVEDLVKEADEAMYEQKKAYYERNGIDRRRISPLQGKPETVKTANKFEGE